VLAPIADTACSSATARPAAQPGDASVTARPAATPNQADVHFMTGMIPHHAQAVLISNWAESHGASRTVQTLAGRIIVSQKDEIALMQRWLEDNRQPVPAADATHMRMDMGGVVHDMLMPGMLTAEQLKQLDAARGTEFDRLFLTFMISHHQGAVRMVNELFDSYGAAQDETVFRFASDVWSDQNAEIDRMRQMLDAMGGRF
jgi:uncharacterized protein (DUF305 family)